MRKPKPNKTARWSKALSVLPMLLAGCSATPLPPSASEPLQIPPAPALSTPVPSQNYSTSARQLIEKWQATLMDMLTMH